MLIEYTELEGCVVITPKVFKDERGYFFESFNERDFDKQIGTTVKFVQDNQSFSTYGTLRGLHFQIGEAAQAKLVRVVKGEVLDVAVDLRKNSATYGRHISVVLSEENHKQLFVPKGFAHGFVVLSDYAIFQYKCDNYYDKSAEGGLRFDDPALNIDWKVPLIDLIINGKDLELPVLEDTTNTVF